MNYSVASVESLRSSFDAAYLYLLCRSSSPESLVLLCLSFTSPPVLRSHLAFPGPVGPASLKVLSNTFLAAVLPGVALGIELQADKMRVIEAKDTGCPGGSVDLVYLDSHLYWIEGSKSMFVAKLKLSKGP